MRKKEKWMFKGALVLALGRKGTITKMEENRLKGTDYVYYITVKLEGEKHAGKYHPSDIQELIPEKPAKEQKKEDETDDGPIGLFK